MRSKRQAERAAESARIAAQAAEYAARARQERKKTAAYRAQLQTSPRRYTRGGATDTAMHISQDEARYYGALARDETKRAQNAALTGFQQLRRDARREAARRMKKARKRLARRLHIPAPTPKHPTPRPVPRTHATPTGAARRTPAPATGKAAPMTQRVKRRGGKFNGSVADKNTTTGKKTVAPNPEQRRLLAATNKAAQIDARLARTEQRIDRMFPGNGT